MDLTREGALRFFAELYDGEHKMHAEMRDDGRGVWSAQHFGPLSSFDDDALTRLVMLAHQRCVRVWVEASAPRSVRIFIQGRQRGSEDISHAHATLFEAVAHATTREERWWRRLEHRAERAHTFPADCWVPVLAGMHRLSKSHVRKALTERCLWLARRIEERRVVKAPYVMHLDDLKATIQALEAFEAFYPAGTAGASEPEPLARPTPETHPELYECEACSSRCGSPMLCDRCVEARKCAASFWLGPRPPRPAPAAASDEGEPT